MKQHALPARRGMTSRCRSAKNGGGVSAHPAAACPVLVSLAAGLVTLLCGVGARAESTQLERAIDAYTTALETTDRNLRLEEFARRAVVSAGDRRGRTARPGSQRRPVRKPGECGSAGRTSGAGHRRLSSSVGLGTTECTGSPEPGLCPLAVAGLGPPGRNDSSHRLALLLACDDFAGRP